MRKKIGINKQVFELFKEIAKTGDISYNMQEYHHRYIGHITAKDENAMLYFFYTCGRSGVEILIQE